MSSIHLDGGETSLIKTLGFGGAPMLGNDLKSRLPTMGSEQLYDILQTLMSLGYVCGNRDLSQAEDIDKTSFYVNPGYAKELKEAIDPSEAPPRPRRVRRE